MKTQARSVITKMIVGSLLMASGAVLAGIDTTPHNLSSSGTGPNSFSGTGEICVFCHTPHGSDASAAVPLWNRAIVSTGYTTYDTLGTSTLDGSIEMGSVSLACLSCHDGTQAMNAVLNQPGMGATGVTAYEAGTWTGGSSPGGITLLGTDLTNDHPVGIQYGGGGLTEAAPTGTLDDPDFFAPSNATINGMTVWWVDTEATANGTREKTDMQLYTRNIATAGFANQNEPFVECASCHDPHTDAVDLFLRIDNDGSAVCLACHDK